MRKTILTALTILTLGGATTGVLIAHAQPAPPPPAAGMDGPPRHHMHAMDWFRRGHEAREQRGHDRMGRDFALVYRQEDRKLTPPDVQKIAEAFLLRNGNHTWKVVEVAPASDGPIGFALATQEGSVVARFTMDPHTGQVTRKG